MLRHVNLTIGYSEKKTRFALNSGDMSVEDVSIDKKNTMNDHAALLDS